MTTMAAVRPKEDSRQVPVGESQLDGYADEMCVSAMASTDDGDDVDLRLYDTYQSALQRVVVDVCLAEKPAGMLSSPGDGADPGDDMLMNFVSWERSLRSNLTDTLWDPHPAEMAGQWKLIDIAGEGSLENILSKDSETVLSNVGASAAQARGREVRFGPSGAVDLVNARGQGGDAVGVSWSFRPGPAHLDTCEFLIRSTSSSSASSETLLRYTGFIDRGQRIESRFSRRPIRMTGRVDAGTSYGDVKASGRFIMLRERTE